MKPESDDRVTEIMAKENLQKINKPLIGITITKEKAYIAYPDLNSNQSYMEHVTLIAEIIDEIISKTNASFIFLPHCIGPDPFRDDRLIAKEIYIRSRMKDHIVLIETEYNAAELKGLIGKFDLFIGERIHSVINAMSMNVPVIALSNMDDERLEIIRMFGQNDAIYPIECLELQPFVNNICDILANTMKIREKMITQLGETRERSMQNGSLLFQLVVSRGG
jgi:polysaccharide pyruvyl transferase WcaK-like protein